MFILNLFHRNKSKFFVNPDRIDTSQQCKAFTKRRQRCRNRTRRSEYCQPHLQKHHNLRITDSKIKGSGLGLFSSRKGFEKNSFIIPYTGTHSSSPINGNYVLQINRKKFINGNRNIDTAGFVNDCRNCNKRSGECRGNNCKFSKTRRNKQIGIIAIKKIKPHEELYVSYGRDYWKKMPKVKSD